MATLNKRFAIYFFERALREGNGHCLMVADVEGVSWQNMDYGIMDAIFNVIDYYYPDQLKYCLLVNLTPLLQPIVTFTKSVAGQQAGKVVVSSTKDLVRYMRKDKVGIPLHSLNISLKNPIFEKTEF